MSFILEIQEIVSGPIKDLFLEITGPVFAAPQLPPVDAQVGPETVGDLNLGSSFGDLDLGSTAGDLTNGDQNLGSTAGDFTNGDQNLGSTAGDIAPELGSTNGDQNLGSTAGDIAPVLGSTNGDQTISGLTLPSIPGSAA